MTENQSNNEKNTKDELRTLLLELSAEELQEYYNFCHKFREKEREVKIMLLHHINRSKELASSCGILIEIHPKGQILQSYEARRDSLHS
jgi:hypothetical protein